MTEPDSLLEAVLAHPDRRRTLLRRYLRNQLHGVQLEALEVRLIEDPELLSEVEAEELLQEGMQAWTAQQLEHSAVVPADVPRPVPAAREQRRPLSLPALAAALLLALLPAAWWLGAQQAGPTAAVAAFHTLQAQRGTESDNASPLPIELAPGATRVVLRMAAPNRPGAQTLELWRAGELQPRARLQGQADSEGWVVVVFERALLTPGRYELRWPAANGPGARTSFEIQKQ